MFTPWHELVAGSRYCSVSCEANGALACTDIVFVFKTNKKRSHKRFGTVVYITIQEKQIVYSAVGCLVSDNIEYYCTSYNKTSCCLSLSYTLRCTFTNQISTTSRLNKCGFVVVVLESSIYALCVNRFPSFMHEQPVSICFFIGNRSCFQEVSVSCHMLSLGKWYTRSLVLHALCKLVKPSCIRSLTSWAQRETSRTWTLYAWVFACGYAFCILMFMHECMNHCSPQYLGLL